MAEERGSEPCQYRLESDHRHHCHSSPIGRGNWLRTRTGVRSSRTCGITPSVTQLAEVADSNSARCGFDSHRSDHLWGDVRGLGSSLRCQRRERWVRIPYVPPQVERCPARTPPTRHGSLVITGALLPCKQRVGVRFPGDPPISTPSVRGRLVGSQPINEGSIPSGVTKLLRALPWGWLGLITRCPIGFESLARYQHRVRPTAGPRSYKPMTGVRIPHPVPSPRWAKANGAPRGREPRSSGFDSRRSPQVGQPFLLAGTTIGSRPGCYPVHDASSTLALPANPLASVMAHARLLTVAVRVRISGEGPSPCAARPTTGPTLDRRQIGVRIPGRVPFQPTRCCWQHS